MLQESYYSHQPHVTIFTSKQSLVVWLYRVQDSLVYTKAWASSWPHIVQCWD